MAAATTFWKVTHWWTSGGEAAAVSELAKAFDASGDHWVDGAIAGSGGTARPIIISRIQGGDPMGATQLDHGQQAQELIKAGLLQDGRCGRGRPLAHHPPDFVAVCLHRGWQGLLCANQHSLVAMALAVQCGLREGRVAGSEELG